MAAMTDEEDQVPIDPTSGRRADWTMDLLREIREQAVDPSYAAVTQAETRAAQADRRHDQDDHGQSAPHTQENGSTVSGPAARALRRIRGRLSWAISKTPVAAGPIRVGSRAKPSDVPRM